MFERCVTANHGVPSGTSRMNESVRAVAREFADIKYDEKIVDAACMHLVMNPGQFDVLVMENVCNMRSLAGLPVAQGLLR